MQTFLPYPDFERVAKSLDYRRLGKQRVEAQQILNTIMFGSGWGHHPVVKMWQPYPDALRLYQNMMMQEWEERGYKNILLKYHSLPKDIVFPVWLGDNRLHASHRATLLFKDYNWYSQWGWEEKPQYGYYWSTDAKNNVTF